jgi:hypothetical protein
MDEGSISETGLKTGDLFDEKVKKLLENRQRRARSVRPGEAVFLLNYLR